MRRQRSACRPLLGVLAIVLAASPLTGELAAPDHVLFGTATRQGALLATGVVEVRLGDSPDTLVRYPIGAVPAYGERFVLRLPMDARDPRRANTARTGEEARLFVDGELAGCVTVGDAGAAQEVDLDTAFDEDVQVWLVDAWAPTPSPPPDARIGEGAAGVQSLILEVRLSRAVRYDVRVDWSTANGTALGGASPSADFRSASGTVLIPEGEVQGYITVDVFGDTLPEADETFSVALANPRRRTNDLSPECMDAGGVVLRPGEVVATVTIVGDDARQAVRVNDTRTLEGDGGTTKYARFLVTADLEVPAFAAAAAPASRAAQRQTRMAARQLTGAAAAVLGVSYATADGTALSVSDYVAKTGTATIDLSIVCPEVAKPCAEVLVEILSDNGDEPDETFFLDLLPPANPTAAGYDILDPRGEATIDSDERFLHYVEAELEGPTCTGCLAGPLGSAISPDGKHLYSAASLTGTIAVFARDLQSGALSLVETQVNDVNGVTGIAGVQSIALSPGGEHVYAAGFFADQIAVFARDADSGALTFLSLANKGGTLLDGPVSLAVSPDGLHVYAAAKLGNAIEVFARNAATGELTFASKVLDDTNLGGGQRLDGLLEPRALLISPDGAHLYVASAVDSAVTMFVRNAGTGALGYLGQVRDATGDPVIDGLNGATALALAPDGLHLYVAGELDDAIAVLRRNPATGLLTFLHRRREGIPSSNPDTGLDRVAAVGVSADGGHVFGASRDGNAITVFERDTNATHPTFGRLTRFVEARRDGESDPNGVPGPSGPVIDGLAGGLALVVSPEPDGRHVYVVGNVDQGIAVFHKDLVAPSTPIFAVPTPSGHTPGVWSNVPHVIVGWHSDDDATGTGLVGYPRLFDTQPATDPGTTLTQLHDPNVDPQTAATTLADGNNVRAHVRACDATDNCSTVAHQGPFLIDTVPPVGPTDFLSTSHLPDVPKNVSEITMTWSSATDAASGIAGYVLFFDGDPATPCSGAPNLAASATTGTVAVADGTVYAHLCAIDVAANRGATQHAGPYLVDTVPPKVIWAGSVAAESDGTLDPNDHLITGPTQLLLTFDSDLALPQDAGAYAVVGAGGDAALTTIECGAAAGDDVTFAIEPNVYDVPSRTIALAVAAHRPLPAGSYRIFACSGSALSDAAGNPLDGNGDATGGDDFARRFVVETTNLVVNPNFDGGLAGWTLSSLGAFGPDGGDIDGLSLFSGAAVSTSSSTQAISQCLPLTEAGGSLGFWTKIVSDRVDSPTVFGTLTFFAGPDCGTDTIGAPVTPTVVGDTGGNWVPLVSPVLQAPAGTQSARIRLVRDPGAATSTVLFDDASFADLRVIFVDGFETGNADRWQE